MGNFLLQLFGKSCFCMILLGVISKAVLSQPAEKIEPSEWKNPFKPDEVDKAIASGIKFVLSNQKDDYVNQLKTQKKTYESEITNLNNKLNSALKTITRDENTIKSDNETITMLREELRLAKMNRDKCIKEAIAAGKRFGFKNATVESNVYRAEIDGLFNDISQELETMKTQNLYAYTLKDHIQHI